MKKSQAQELGTSTQVGGRIMPASGSRRGMKGDARVIGELRIENKFTEAKQWPLKLDDLKLIASRASGGEIPVLQLDYRQPPRTQRYAVVRWSDLLALLEAAEVIGAGDKG
jgi:hypothetical protein